MPRRLLDFLADFEQLVRVQVMSTDAGRRRTSTLAGVDHATLLAAVAAGRVEAVEEVYDRHASALCRLALLIARDRKPPEDADQQSRDEADAVTALKTFSLPSSTFSIALLSTRSFTAPAFPRRPASRSKRDSWSSGRPTASPPVGGPRER